MKKHLPTDAITHELAQSVFFPKRGIEPPNEGTSDLANARTGTRVSAPPPELLNARTPEVANERGNERAPSPPPVKPNMRATERSNGRTDKKAPLPEKTERYSFEIYPSQKERIEEHLYQHKRKTKEKISASNFIRTAINYYFKSGIERIKNDP